MPQAALARASCVEDSARSENLGMYEAPHAEHDPGRLGPTVARQNIILEARWSLQLDGRLIVRMRTSPFRKHRRRPISTSMTATDA